MTIWAVRAVLAYTHGLSFPDYALFPANTVFIIFTLFAVNWISFVPLDGFFRLLSGIPGVRRFFCASYTQKFCRYFAPGFKPLDKT
jgi:hypothetical protein